MADEVTQERGEKDDDIVPDLIEEDDTSVSERDNVSKSFINIESQMYRRSSRLADKKK